jgi:DNA-directed RNA polymerase specialized sigma24 family protein
MRGNTDSNNAASQEHNKLTTDREIFWAELYFLLRPLVKHWVCTARISSWLGQQEDLIEDIVQETIFKLLNYTQRAEKGEVAPVQNIEHLAITIARNYFRDLKRKDRRIDRFELYDRTSLEHVVKSKNVDPSEIALNHVYYAWVFMKLAEFVVTVSTKQQTALLRDLSQRMSFGQAATLLQQVFADKGLDLKRHQDWKSSDKREQSQHAANLSLSYKKIEKWSKEVSLL